MGHQRRMHLNGFKAATVSHTTAGLWRHPASEAHRYRELSFWVETARTLEAGCFDCLFVADALGVHDVYRGDVSRTLAEGLQTPTDDPLMVVSAMAAATSRLGFGITVSSTYELPYKFARSMTTLDHLTDGRIGWNVVTSGHDSAARNLGLTTQLGPDARYEIADEFMEVAYKLWEGSWEDDAVIIDRSAGVYADPAKVHPIEHHGPHFDVPGIFLAEPSRQRTPVIFQAGSSPAGLAFAARHAEAVFMSGQRPDILAPRVAEIRRLARRNGRDPASIKIVAIMSVVAAPTDHEARAKFDDYRQYSSVEGNLVRLSGVTQVDMAKYDLDEPLRYEDAPGIRSILANFTDADGSRAWTPRQIAEHMAVSSFGPVVVGSPVAVADELERWMDEADIDGFNITDVMPPASFRDMVELVVPELQRRGRVWSAYEGSTLREYLQGVGQTRVRGDHAAARFARDPRPIVGRSAFVSADVLATMLDDPSVRIVDARSSLSDPAGGDAGYAAAHLAGAIRFDWIRDLSDPHDPLPGQLAPAALLSERLGAVGIGAGHRVVAYDDGDGYTAARMLWALRHLGFVDVQILEGGLAAWVASGRPLTVEVVEHEAVPPPDLTEGSLRATKDEVLALLDEPPGSRPAIVDCRMSSTFEAAGAHIPTASRLPAPALFATPTGVRIAPDEVRRLAEQAGIVPSGPTVLYCGGGVSASAVYAALDDLGYRGLRVYDGSWSEWGSDPDTPKEPNP